MRHWDATHADRHDAEVQDLLFKPDRPRPIDRYIDFFGGSTAGDELVGRHDGRAADEHPR
jgi:hypothetical protein